MSKLYVYMMRSRNKDNKNIEGFKERCKVVVDYEDNYSNIDKMFDDFARKGLAGEKTRLYRSVNSRNENKIYKDLIIRLIKHEIEHEPFITKINSLVNSVALQCENRAESKWLFDFDSLDYRALQEFSGDLFNLDIIHYIHNTPNGYAIVCEHGFDTRKLMEKWKDYDITLKRDGLLFLDIKQY